MGASPSTNRPNITGEQANAADTLLEFLAEKLPLTLWTTDRGLKVTSYWSSKSRPVAAFDGSRIGQSVQEFLGINEASQSPVKEHHLALQGTCSRLEYAAQARLYDLHVEPYRNSEGAITGCISMALDITERRRSEKEIQYRATHDGLTGLVNYREFVDCLEREVRRAGRTGQPFAVLLLDLDDLKLINDRLGHMAGNNALQRLATVMKDHSRSTDVAARFGGDEFAVLLLDADAERAQNVAERIRSRLRLHPEPPTLSVSIGLAVFPGDGPDGAELLETADRRLYKDKKSRSTRGAHPVEQKSPADL